MSIKGYVYRHIRLDRDEVFYIGVGFDGNFKRSRQKYNRNEWWRRIVGVTPYEIEIVLYDLPKDKTFEKEIELIKLYGRRDKGAGTLVNLTDGGEGSLGTSNKKGYKVSEEQKRKFSLLYKGRKLSEETKLKISQSMKGRDPNNHDPFKKRVIQKTKDGLLVKIWDYVKQTKQGGFNSAIVSRCCNGYNNSHAGYVWEFENPEHKHNKSEGG